MNIAALLSAANAVAESEPRTNRGKFVPRHANLIEYQIQRWDGNQWVYDSDANITMHQSVGGNKTYHVAFSVCKQFNDARATTDEKTWKQLPYRVVAIVEVTRGNAR